MVLNGFDRKATSSTFANLTRGCGKGGQNQATQSILSKTNLGRDNHESISRDQDLPRSKLPLLSPGLISTDSESLYFYARYPVLRLPFRWLANLICTYLGPMAHHIFTECQAPLRYVNFRHLLSQQTALQNSTRQLFTRVAKFSVCDDTELPFSPEPNISWCG